MTLAGLLVVLAVSADTSAAPARVVYPAPESALDRRHEDVVELVTSALERTAPEFGPFTIEPAAVMMNEVRALEELRRGGAVNLVWAGTSRARERDLLPIRIPMRKGILGYRIAFIATGTQKRIDRVRTLSDLRSVRVGQGTGWGDVAVYEANGVPVVTAEYESLFDMVVAGRFELLPRGINEVFTELDERSADLPGLAIERGLVLYYPWPFYCFLNRADQALARRIETGLRRMLKDGSFDRILLKHHGESIRKARLDERRRIDLVNPDLPPETPLADPTLWLVPGRGAARP